ncbi:calponin homology domain-containing protein [Astyanax mexicanus]|uniref:Calponin homology domain-containing protein n=1 Tax=Astyanax mexicanus TaxID=7994 RepID=A0A8T2KYJ4_ASTMX|nr:calponin homology domain-containing protein [Astyanax mexicanus]
MNQQRLQAIADRFQQLVNRASATEGRPSTSGTMVDRLREFRRDQEPRRTGPAKQRLTTIRLAVLPSGQDTLFIPRPGSTVKKVVVPLSMPEAAFIEKIREEFPAVQGDFCLFRVDRQRRIHRLELTSVCPAAKKISRLHQKNGMILSLESNSRAF